MQHNTLKVLIVVGDFYPEVSELLIEGAVTELEQCAMQVGYEVLRVPGSFEVPAAIVFAIMSDKENYDGYIGLGCVIKGMTDHYHHVAASVSTSLGEVAAQHAVPLGFGVITADTLDLALDRADKKGKNIGGGAAAAALRMIELYKRFLG